MRGPSLSKYVRVLIQRSIARTRIYLAESTAPLVLGSVYDHISILIATEKILPTLTIYNLLARTTVANDMAYGPAHGQHICLREGLIQISVSH